MSLPRPTDIPKTYQSALVEKKWLKIWQEKQLFHAPTEKTKKKVFSMVIPPPNITGVLHMGHALNNTLQDIVTRFKRMQGFETLWMPGTDHAGIATQNVVEKSLKSEGTSREDLGREGFIEKGWEWRERCGSTIVEQLKRMGCSCDWERIRFTMDEGLSEAVREVFVTLYDKGLIYRSNYIINWCPRCQTALSDEEVTHRDIQGALYHIEYAVEGEDQKVTIATTRPETMLGDTGVGFNPKDKRYQFLKGKTLILPLLGRKLQVIQDTVIDPEFGTGVLKITPAHDPVDFELGKKHQLAAINILNEDGTLNEHAGPYQGMERFDARKKIIQDLKEQGLLTKITDHQHAVGHCYRCDTIVEPYCSDQWFVRMKPLAEPAIEAVKSGQVRFIPERWTKVYMEWMTNIRDWCISRQIWWGHRIPVYYASDGSFTAARNEAEARKRLKLSETDTLHQDEDVLDTWFSSWLWPFSTLGWPHKTKELSLYYPTTSLVTGYEIIFFWVARMIMAGCEFMKKPPFQDIYIHGIVRDQEGQKMSKSKGNVVDPLEIIDEFGADALRYCMISITAEGQDVHASKERFELGRNFANKIWNASRYVISNLTEASLKKPSLKDLNATDQWILSRLQQTTEQITKSLESYRFHEASSKLYDFFWGEFCDWYLEWSKPHANQPGTQWALRTVLETSLKLLHPFMPFITEEIWEILKEGQDAQCLMVDEWPEVEKAWVNTELEEEIREVIHQIQSIRNIRATWKINPKEQIRVVAKARGKGEEALLKCYEADLKHLARLGDFTYGTKAARPEQSVVATVGRIESYVVLEGLIDVKTEVKRIESRLQEVEGFLKSTEKRLKNRSFVDKAPEEVVQKEKEKFAKLDEQKKRLEENLQALQ